MKRNRKPKHGPPKRVLRLLDLDHAKSAVLNTLLGIAALVPVRNRRLHLHRLVLLRAKTSVSTRPLYFDIGCSSKIDTSHPQPSISAWRRSADLPTKQQNTGLLSPELAAGNLAR